MIVINLQPNGNILVIDTTGEYFEYTFDKYYLLKEFNISLDGLFSLTFEPSRNLFIIEKNPGEIVAFNDPDENIILSKINKKQKEIIQFAKNKSLQEKLPPLHVIKNGRAFLPEENREEYLRQKKAKQAITILKDTAWALLLAKEYNMEVPGEILEAVEKAFSLVSQEDIWKAAKIDARISASPGSETRRAAGLEKHILDIEEDEKNCDA